MTMTDDVREDGVPCLSGDTRESGSASQFVIALRRILEEGDEAGEAAAARFNSAF